MRRHIIAIVAHEPGRQPDLREHLAAERTFLAYIRTGLALMGFGFVVARFSVFMQRFASDQSAADSPELSLWFGTALVILGVIVNALSVFEYRSLIKRLNRAHAADWPPARLPIATAAVVATFGVLMAVYLLCLR